MATVAEKYGLPRFVPTEDVDVLRNWARTAPAEELRHEHRLMRECVRQWPRYRSLLSWLETVAELRGVDLWSSLRATA